MQIKELYKFQRLGGGTTVSPIKPEEPYILMYRIIAGEGMLVTQNGKDTYSVVDTDNPEGWYEVEDNSTEDIILDDLQMKGEIQNERKCM